jgi:predicted Ser/Thr protein kinase/dienelactone hydrolase
VIGETLSHYLIVEKLGEGGIGVLYRARDARLGRDVAIKVLRSEAKGDSSRRRRLLQEAKAASALNHPHIVTVYDVGRVPVAGREVDFIAMECVEGRSLAQVMSERTLGVPEALDYAVQIAEALAVAHAAGIVHRDVKPANVMISDAGRVKVLDFGLAKLMDVPEARYAGPTEDGGGSSAGETQTREGALVGTLAYVSPEQAEGKPVDPRTDVFSLGILLFEMLAARHPFRGESEVSTLSSILRETPPPLRSSRREVPRDLDRVVQRCLAKDREQRYASGGEVLLDLEACRARMAARASGWRAVARRPRFLVVGAAVLVAIVGVAGWTWHRGAPERRALLALSEIDRLQDANENYEAYWVARQAEPDLAGDARLVRFWKERCFFTSLRTSPPGASVSVKRYGTPDEEWKPIGRTPLEHFPMPIEMLRMRITREGFEPVDATFAPGPETRAVSYTLDPTGSCPRAWCGSAADGSSSATTRRSRSTTSGSTATRSRTGRIEFVEAGGYRKREFWKEPFVKDGRTLSWEEAMASFRDATGRPGPAAWELGTYADGTGDDPVGGVSWFEAAAFAEFAGKALPTFYHWFKATDIGSDLRFADIIGFSNFGGHGPVRVGSLGGVAPFGTVDMAGNVREWCSTGSSLERYALGGAWSDVAVEYIDEARMSPWTRLAVNGFRCARYSTPPPALPAPTREAWRDYAREKPVSDEAFESYRHFFSYDRTDLKATVESVEESEHWRREIVSFDAAYGHERVPAHLFLPRDAKPPYQAVVFYPTGGAFFQRSSDSLQMSAFDYLIHSGRAVLHPVYKGTYERRTDEGDSGPNAERDLVVQQVKDFRRALDYLETRPDIDSTRLAVLGVSGFFELYVLALDDRLKVGIAQAGGLAGSRMPAEIDPINFAPRIHQPFLLLNGRYDSGYPVDLLQKPLLRLLGTPGKDRRHVLLEMGHAVGRSPERARETVDWLDRYLGPVEHR